MVSRTCTPVDRPSRSSPPIQRSTTTPGRYGPPVISGPLGQIMTQTLVERLTGQQYAEDISVEVQVVLDAPTLFGTTVNRST